MKYIITPITLLISGLVFSQEKENNTQKDSVKNLKEVVISANQIIGSKFEAANKTGSASYISAADLQKFNYTDINRVLRTVTGVNVYEEDGFGLRPNISLRGTSPDRSAKITLMEDNVLIAPAPYSAPAAYYFPSVARMNAVEILKGSSQIQYGPFTTGGTINFVSAPIPTKFSAGFLTDYGSFNTSRTVANVGIANETVGAVVQFLNYNSDGFKNLPSGANTGFDKKDVMAKFRVQSKPTNKIYNALDFKMVYAEEDANETYLGLTEEDFNNSPFMRYAGSEKDNITTKNNQFSVTHTLKTSNYFSVTTTAYRNKFARNWYKLNDVRFGGTTYPINAILEDPTTNALAFDYVTGAQNSPNNALRVRANNRGYLAQGVQTKLDFHFLTGDVYHDLEVGVRYHKDSEDRFQWNDSYAMIDGSMVLTTAGTPGTQDNRVAYAKALAAHALYKIKYNNLTVTPGIRFETIDLLNKNYGTNDVTRTGVNLVKNDNHVKVWLPGIGANYRFNNYVSLFGGVHKGFAPPTNTPGTDAENSTNYEIGTRYNYKKFSGELVVYFNDYKNLLGSDLAASGGSGTLDQFNAGEAHVKGIEFLINYQVLKEESKFKLPITFGYTLTDTEFVNEFASSDGAWGTIEKGDEIPYISKHQFNASIALEHAKFELILGARYSGEFRTVAGQGSIPNKNSVPSNTVVDFGSKYKFNKHFSLTGNINNLFDTTYLVSRVPAGLRPGMPFSASIGIAAQF
ncbi:TonB-dependent receptor family protein [Flavobacterium lacisediminis]|uniref:TonB-dependent receptor n=1 Tax=Flavobacterium lacisediminis TaxID=2989705 RepID=A0ABT3EE31_9FLAO|nr:TonB-dependent receptor [Flavobacterium lacisediminis]MCW1146816.1 TonB-dependent receptor [Flavobacterium lacisediminis]